MNPSPTPNSQATARLQASHAKWTPPAWLIDVVSGDDSLLADLIDTFKTTTEASLLKLHTALAAADTSRLRTEAHRVKGGAKQVGADALAEACQALELESSVAPVPRLSELVRRCHELFSEAESGMTSYFADHGAADDQAAH